MSDKTIGNEAGKKGCSFQTAFAIVLVISTLWVVFGISVFSEWPSILATSIIPIGSLVLSWYKKRIGGLLTIISSFVPLITLSSLRDISSDPFYGVGIIFLLIFVTSPLFIAGIMIYNAPSKEERREIAERTKGEGKTFDYTTNKCPYCNSTTIEGGIIHQAENDKEREKLGYKAKWQRVCLKCKSKWVAVEK